MSNFDENEKNPREHLNKKMNRDLKRKWVKALESGRYDQCDGALQNSDGQNCCLGVLCRVMKLKAKSFDAFGDLDEIGLDKVIPQSVRSTLIDMNDSKGKSFKEIAAFIKKNKNL